MAKTELFLAAGTRFVVQSQKPGAKAVWHVSKKDVTLPAGEPNKRECPITGQTVNWTVIDGFSLFYPARIVRVRLKLEAGDVDNAKLAQFKPVHFGYYIPDSAIDPDDANGKRKFPNPSDFLRRFAIRTDDGGSSWLMNQGDIPYNLMAKMQDAGAVPFVARLHPDDAMDHILSGIVALQRQIVAAVVSAEQSHAAADGQLQTATETTGKTAEQAEKYYAQRGKAIAKRLGELAEDLTAAATHFGINPEMLQLTGLVSTADTIMAKMAKQAQAYREAAGKLKLVGTTDATAMGNAAEQDMVPVEAVAGALEDAGDDAGAAKLMAAFADETPAIDNGVFSPTEECEDAA